MVSRNAPTMYQQLKAGHDRNGNPRRVFILLDASGDIVQAIDEGYTGMPKVCGRLVQLPTLNIEPAEYRSLLKEYQK